MTSLDSGTSGPQRGEIWFTQQSSNGREQPADGRPYLVVSHDLFNTGPSGLVVTCPLTRTERDMRWHVGIFPPEANIDRRGFIMSEAVRSMEKRRFQRRVGVVNAATLERVEEHLRILLGL